MPLALLIFLFLLKERYFGDRWMSLSVHPVGSNISDPFLTKTEHHSCNQLVLCISEHYNISCWAFFSFLPHFFTGNSDIVYMLSPHVFRCRTLGCLIESSLNADYASCTFLSSQARLLLLSPASTRFWVQVFPTGRCGSLTIFHHSPLNFSCPGQPWGIPFRQSDRNLRRRDCHTLAPSSCHFKLRWWKGWRLSFPLWTTSWVNNLGFSPGALWRKEPAFQYHSLIFLSIISKRGIF